MLLPNTKKLPFDGIHWSINTDKNEFDEESLTKSDNDNTILKIF